MPFLPSSTNAQYAGAPIAAHFLTLVGVLTILPGLIHTFLPDGGAGVIAGLDLSVNGAIVIGVFAWAGATQIVWGTTLLVASRRYRSLVPPLRAMKASVGTPSAVHWSCHGVNYDRAAIAQVPPQQHATRLSSVASMLDIGLHHPPGRDTDLKPGSIRPKKDQRPALVLFVHHLCSPA